MPSKIESNKNMQNGNDQTCFMFFSVKKIPNFRFFPASGFVDWIVYNIAMLRKPLRYEFIAPIADQLIKCLFSSRVSCYQKSDRKLIGYNQLRTQLKV